MNINRDNYEEYFLLYADNELTDSEKAEVLLFVRQHKDLEDEFRMIHHTISRPDTNINLTDKSFLFRNDTKAFINVKNYEEVFVLYHDNELTEKQRLETETFLSLHKELKSDFDLIGLARLTPEMSVVFPGKKILYKKEKFGKVVPVIFWRMFAAAVFIGFGLWIINSFFIKPLKIIPAITHSVVPTNSLPKIDKPTVPEKKVTEVVAQSPFHINENSKDETDNKKGKNLQRFVQKNNTNNAVVKHIVDKQKTTKKNINNQLPIQLNEPDVVSSNELKNISKDEISTVDNIDPGKKLVQNSTQLNAEKTDRPAYATTASYIADDESKNQNYVFYDITTTEFKKTKVGGFLKKVKRVIARNNPIGRILSGDERQVVAK